MANEMKNIDAVFEGGGVKGSGLVGAVEVTERLGYSFVNVAGTSAGAIVAALVAAGYTSAEMREILEELDYIAFKDKGLIGHVPYFGAGVNLLLKKGIYEGDFFLSWMREKLAQKNIHTFADLILPEYESEARYRYRLQVIASDLTRSRMLVLPRDIALYGREPDELEVALAVRMSMSIPFFYKPVVLNDAEGSPHYIVDGGVLSNYPVWLFDATKGVPPWPTIGYKLVDPKDGDPDKISGPISLLSSLFSTMMEAHDARYIESQNFMRTVPIPTLGVHTTEFDITSERKQALYGSGVTAAEKFFDRWDFEEYKKIRAEEEKSRSESVWDEKKEK